MENLELKNLIDKYYQLKEKRKQLYHAKEFQAFADMFYQTIPLREQIALIDPNWKDIEIKSHEKILLPENHPLRTEFEDLETMIRDYIKYGKADMVKDYFVRRDFLLDTLIPEEEIQLGLK